MSEEETFIVKRVDREENVSYPLTVARSGRIMSSTKNKERAGRFNGEQINAMGKYTEKKKLKITLTIE